MRYTAVPIKMPKPRGFFTEYSKKSAQKLARRARSLKGKDVVLFGGGSYGQEWVGKVRKVSMKRPFNYKTKRYEKKSYNVAVKLEFPNRKSNPSPYAKSRYFEPHLGSWKLARIKKVK